MKHWPSIAPLYFGICLTTMGWCSIHSDVLAFAPHNDPIVIGRRSLERGRWGMASTSRASPVHLRTLTLDKGDITVHPTRKLRGGGNGTILGGQIKIDTKPSGAQGVFDVEVEQEEGFKVGAAGKERTVYEGDYLVHEDAGICRFLCVSKSTDESTGIVEDAIQLEFREVTVHVLLKQRTKLTRFRSRDVGKLRLSRWDDYRTWRVKRLNLTHKVGSGFSKGIRPLLVGLLCKSNILMSYNVVRGDFRYNAKQKTSSITTQSGTELPGCLVSPTSYHNWHLTRIFPLSQLQTRYSALMM